MSSYTPQQQRDIGVTIYTLSSGILFYCVCRNALGLYQKRSLLVAISLLCACMGFITCMAAYLFSTSFVDYSSTCPIRKPMSATFHNVALTCSDVVMYYKMRAVNIGKERTIFTVIGALLVLLRFSASTYNIFFGGTSFFSSSGACVFTYTSEASIFLAAGIVASNIGFGFMFIYPLRAHLKKMGSMKSSSDPSDVSPAHQLIKTLVDSGLRWALASSAIAIVTYSCIAGNVLGNLTGALSFVYWDFMTICITNMLLETPRASPSSSKTSSTSRHSAPGAKFDVKPVVNSARMV